MAASDDKVKPGKFDLMIRNGTLVVPGLGVVAADVGVVGGRITALGDGLSGSVEETIDARGMVVLPGFVDPHTHLGNELSFEEEATTETRAAVLGGVTTIGVFLREIEESHLGHLPAFRRAIDERSYVDAVFHPQIFTEAQIMEIPDTPRSTGSARSSSTCRGSPASSPP
jgi:dihydroorotase-like cyclic amidohydrolase